MGNDQLLVFLPREVTPGQVVAAGRKFGGLRYRRGASIVWGQKTDGTPAGECDCVGLWLLVFEELGLLAPGFDKSVPFHIFKAEREAVLMKMLRLNFTPFPVDEIQPADLFFFNCTGRIGDDKHVGMRTENEPHARLLVAQNDIANGQGKVLERLMTEETDQIRGHVWRLKNITTAK